VVFEALVKQEFLVHMVVDGLELHSHHAQFSQVLDHRLRAQPCVCATYVLGHVRVQVCALHLCLIDDSLVPRDTTNLCAHIFIFK